MYAFFGSSHRGVEFESDDQSNGIDVNPQLDDHQGANGAVELVVAAEVRHVDSEEVRGEPDEHGGQQRARRNEAPRRRAHRAVVKKQRNRKEHQAEQHHPSGQGGEPNSALAGDELRNPDFGQGQARDAPNEQQRQGQGEPKCGEVLRPKSAHVEAVNGLAEVADEGEGSVGGKKQGSRHGQAEQVAALDGQDVRDGRVRRVKAVGRKDVAQQAKKFRLKAVDGDERNQRKDEDDAGKEGQKEAEADAGGAAGDSAFVDALPKERRDVVEAQAVKERQAQVLGATAKDDQQAVHCGRTLKLRSTARAEWVRAPTEMKSTPVLA